MDEGWLGARVAPPPWRGKRVQGGGKEGESQSARCLRSCCWWRVLLCARLLEAGAQGRWQVRVTKCTPEQQVRGEMGKKNLPPPPPAWGMGAEVDNEKEASRPRAPPPALYECTRVQYQSCVSLFYTLTARGWAGESMAAMGRERGWGWEESGWQRQRSRTHSPPTPPHPPPTTAKSRRPFLRSRASHSRCISQVYPSGAHLLTGPVSRVSPVWKSAAAAGATRPPSSLPQPALKLTH